ncbi:putative E3 ubiquitin-protein ligase RNF19B-like [Penaeus vannamei]|uniref:Putative E3 ubiquitin-protein ligase RNF19B-like n=1 Tax=Penaeus vannamei TaxID=6689 RepID=A0A3R7M873_PENVA|nr:putative E3 ubiquitin-protein ligase RNF19B-like [Penaeus vannamei]
MIIGIPIWVGRKLHARYSNGSRHRRNLAVVGGVTASAVISPVLAGLAVSIGVPILLAYVYGVVPISLCRSGGCGVTTSASGVRLLLMMKMTWYLDYLEDNQNQAMWEVEQPALGRCLVGHHSLRILLHMS